MKDKIKEIILSVNPGMDVEDEDFNIAEDMDSMDILALMEELEDAFDIEITMEEKNEENFSSIDALAEMIEYGTEAMSVVENGKIKGTLWLNDIVNIFQKG